MKSLADVREDMSVLYDEVLKGNTELKTADTLANISGKIIKAYQLELARDIFLDGRHHATQMPQMPQMPGVVTDKARSVAGQHVGGQRNTWDNPS